MVMGLRPTLHHENQLSSAGAGAHRRGGDAMERVIERCCGLDVHKKTVVACVRVPGRTSGREQHVRTFGTTTAELLALRDWLGGYGVTHVAMESTGVYWKPIFYVLEDAFTCVLANAAQIAQVPGRKTDVKDCAWIAQLLEHGLVRGSFVPPVPIRELRDLTRYRAALQLRDTITSWATSLTKFGVSANAISLRPGDDLDLLCKTAEFGEALSQGPYWWTQTPSLLEG